jgi:hypothetical protein
MEKRSSNYNNSKIFKIINNTNGECYYSCTIDKLNGTWNSINTLYNNWLAKPERANKPNNFNLFKLRDTESTIVYNNVSNKYGLHNCTIVLVELYPCTNILELKQRLEYYIITYPCITTKNNYILEAEDNLDYTDTETNIYILYTAIITSNTSTAWSYVN